MRRRDASSFTASLTGLICAWRAFGAQAAHCAPDIRRMLLSVYNLAALWNVRGGDSVA
ncbi:MAG: hypothetical protein LBF60_01950 [Treponema sp.]|nr:hypothetical protein [Treponema sp.]